MATVNVSHRMGDGCPVLRVFVKCGQRNRGEKRENVFHIFFLFFFFWRFCDLVWRLTQNVCCLGDGSYLNVTGPGGEERTGEERSGKDFCNF